ncbi:MAG TPA: hypothetical protein VF042_09830 [Gemmatimonadaceae bacterium]
MKKVVLLSAATILLGSCRESTSIVASKDMHARRDVSVDEIVATSAVRGVVLPAAYQSIMGEINNSWPHANANMRYQQVFLGSELGDADRISGLCLRHDELFGGREVTAQLAVKLGPTALDNTNLGLTFDDNYSAPPTEVFTGAITIPATAGAGDVGMFDFCIDFTTQYIHQPGANLIVEMINTTPTIRSHPKDACSSGPGCTTRRVVAFSSSAASATLTDDTGLIMAFITPDPAGKVDCKDGNWEEFGFVNQGQCIRFVNTNKDSRE